MRQTGYAALLTAVVLALVAGFVSGLRPLPSVEIVAGLGLVEAVVKVLSVAAVTLGFYGAYLAVVQAVQNADRRRRENFKNLLRLVLFVLGTVSVLAVITEQWLGLLLSLGVVGFAVTFALQQPLFSLIGWAYIMVKEPYQVGDRVSIEGTKGDVIGVDFFVTKLWEIDGELVSSNQPSGRLITVPNSAVLSSHVFNYTWEDFPYVWNEIAVQVAYETDLDFATRTMVDVADEVVGDEMETNIGRYRSLLAETPVELEVRDRPSVNVKVESSWVELRLRYLVHPKRGQRVKNELYSRVLDRFNGEPEKVKFPVGRNR